jgi:hypothetical protein
MTIVVRCWFRYLVMPPRTAHVTAPGAERASCMLRIGEGSDKWNGATGEGG